MLVVLPFFSHGQTTIVNYDFNNATSYATATAATASGVTSSVVSSEGFVSGAGIATGAAAFSTNVSGPALAMTSSSGTNTKYFQFELSGASLPKYSAFKLYLQGIRSTTGATTLTLQYSVNGGSFVTFGSTYAPGNPSFTEGGFDLSGLAALNAPASLTFKLSASGASGSGTLRVDNFQVQGVNTVDPLINSLSPNTIEAGSADFPLVVTGSNFKPGAVVSFNGQNLATTYSSSTSLLATVPAAAVTAAGSYPVVVTNPGGAVNASTTFAVTPALVHWTGTAGTNSWFEPTNWSTGTLPISTDEVVLDHRYVAGSFTVSLDQNTAVTIKSLTINPGAGDSIFAVVPPANMMATALNLNNTGSGVVALAIYNKGVVINASGASSGAGIDVANLTASNPGATAFIYNGGSYRHSTVRSHTAVVENLSAVAGTELGIFDFRPLSTGSGSTSLSLSGRTYGTIILRSVPGRAATSYTGGGTTLTVQGDLLIGPGVTFSPALGNTLTLLGSVRSQGTFQFKNASPATTTSQLLLAGTKPQTLTGAVLLDTGIGLAINNPAGVVVATPLLISGPLGLTSGTITTTAANLLTLTSTANLMGGSSTSYINGPLARQTAAGPVSNLVFPVGSGTTYRPVVLNATAQAITTYLVTPTQGPAPDYNNLPASTSALPSLMRVSRAWFYTITPTPAANNFSGTVKLPFDPTDQVNAPDDASFVIGKNSGSGWQNIDKSGVSVTAPAPAGGYASGTITSGTFTSFSTFALASTSPDATINPLPVTLTSFSAVRQASGAVRVRWATSSEQRSDHFEVQRSSNAGAFTTIATTVAHGTTSQAQAYTSLDEATPVGKLYYRLKEVSTDGSLQYSPVVALGAAEAAATPSLYPNPTRDRLVVPAVAGQPVQILDLTGRLLQTISLPPSGEVSVAQLSAGTYLLQTVLAGQWHTFRFNKL